MNKAVFLDRDGVVNHDPDDYTYLLSETTILPGIVAFAQKVVNKGYKIIVITNQGGIDKGRYGHDDVAKVNGFIKAEFEKAGVAIEDFFYCPHHNAVQNCLCRKPHSLLLQRGLYKHNAAASQSYFIGDKWRDIECAEKAGVTGLKIDVNVISDNLIDLIA